jgi:starch phosphorylase
MAKDPVTQRYEMDKGRFLRDIARRLKYSLAKDRYSATAYDHFLSTARAARDHAVKRWIETQQMYHDRNVKRVYYLSLEFLLGRSLQNNLINLGAETVCHEALLELGYDKDRLAEIEPDAGLGNGGLGRLAACFLDSLATHAYPAMGYGLRYEYGIFRQIIRDGAQVEEPDNWLRLPHPWEFARPEYIIPVHFGGRVEADPSGPVRFRWVDTHVVHGMPYDIPVVGYGGGNVNTLRLWSARSAMEFDFEDFSAGDYAEAVEHKVHAETITKVLYPDDRVYAGRELRLRQQYFLVSCTLQDILRRHRHDRNPLEALPDKAAIQLNDTHPALAIAELMRLLVDVERMPWQEAWAITTATVAYTNHTLMPEALEKWPVEMIERLLPRHFQILCEINRQFLDDVARRWPGDADRLRRMSLIDEDPPRKVRMAHLATVGSHAINGVSAIHSELVKSRLLPDFHAMYPERFTNVTNGITPRRWLRLCNPGLSALITERLGGEGWVADLDRLRAFEPAARDPGFQDRFLAVKRKAKEDLAAHITATMGVHVDPGSLFDVQVKRLHEYKRQLLNVLHVALLYLRLRENPNLDEVPRTFLIGGKAAPAYWMMKRILRLIHAVARAIDEDPAVRGRLRVVFLPDYRVSLAERIIPAADVSEQISTAGAEASGTSNMKFALNGALTVGTLDGANIEIREAVGADNFFHFGLTAEAVEALRASGRNTGQEVCEADPEIRRAIEFLFSSHFDRLRPGDFEPIRQAILRQPDPWMHLADLRVYAEAQEQVGALYRKPRAWARKALLNVARMGRFSSDRAVREYAESIWGLEPAPINPAGATDVTIVQARRQSKTMRWSAKDDPSSSSLEVPE